MSTTGSDLIADGIDANLDHMHKRRWTERSAELHAKVDRAESDVGEAGEQTRRALRDQYADRFLPETSRMQLMDQAAAIHRARQPTAASTLQSRGR